VYIPNEDLRRFGAHELEEMPVEQAAQLIRFEADRAAAWFDRGLALAQHLDRRSASCVLAMTGIYRCILERITLEPEAVLERRVSLPAWEKAWVAARSLSGRQARGGYG
jgi:phytoene synthase